MPKAKNRRKNGKTPNKYNPDKNTKVIDFKSLSGLEQYKLLHGGKVNLPKCKICGSDTEFASEEDVMAYKRYDTLYPYNFIIQPKCNCYLEHEEWMEE